MFHSFRHDCLYNVIYYLSSPFLCNKHELVQVVIAANVTRIHKTHLFFRLHIYFTLLTLNVLLLSVTVFDGKIFFPAGIQTQGGSDESAFEEWLDHSAIICLICRY